MPSRPSAEHGPPDIKIQNLSGKPIFDHGCVIASKTRRQIAKLERKGWTNSGPFRWPPENKFSYRGRHSFLNFHDGSELYLADQPFRTDVRPRKRLYQRECSRKRRAPCQD